jgi:hypothetical protein
MPDCTAPQVPFPKLGRRTINVRFDDGAVSSDGGLLLLRQVERRLGLLKAVATVLPDPRQPWLVEHTTEQLLRQRVFGLCQGYEDLNDHHRLREDLALQTALGRVRPAASSPTLCRFEQRSDRRVAVATHRILVDQFIPSFARAPGELVLDFDATDDPVHGQQEGRHFSGYYDHYCFLPLYVFCGEQLLVAHLRSAKKDAALHAAAILKLLVTRLRQAWPGVRIIFRGDSGFCRPLLLSWCERNHVRYVVGIGKNSRLLADSEWWREKSARAAAWIQQPQRIFAEFPYRAGTWPCHRRLIVKAEHNAQGANPRFVVTNLRDEPRALYEEVYCARGETENRIKECQLGLFADRTSCQLWWPNQFRLLLASLAYVLMERLRAVGLAGTELARAQVWILRCRPLQVGAVIVRNTRRVRFYLASAFPHQAAFQLAAQRFATG